ncbi:hypothetical protein [Clostridium sp. C8-1-8]|uniref:hypothetical protein n=1 Tax=Clostridium sp. C8-1-8 TaxID=2698831 RepID=UPI00136BE6AC|nr:hypothetical protein [Clostridium sp. C8-1-8]
MVDKQLSINNNIEYDSGKDKYPEFEQSVKRYFDSIINIQEKLFTTNSEGLFEAYLNNLPREARQHYNCKACKNFIERYGALVTISEYGEIHSAIWNEIDTPDFFKESVKAMKNIVLKSEVSGVFISELKKLGQSITGRWSHLSVSLPAKMVYRPRLINASQAMAEKLEEFRILKNSILEYPSDAVEQAVTLLRTEALYRSEKCLGVAEWLMDLHDRLSKVRNKYNSDNIIWLAVAMAPTGYCHVKSSMIGTLLDDIISGLSYELVSRRFAEKMHPLRYQRPQAAPTEGNIAQAEKIVEKLGIDKSLVRRFARVEELKKLWTTKKEKDSIRSSGVFSHLTAKYKKENDKMEIPAVTMTWRKFSETVLPLAEGIEYLVQQKRDNYSAIVTASNEEAPPILQWDNEDKRNPFSWYVYSGGSDYRRWGLAKGYCKVTAICLQPTMWYGEYPHQSKSVFFILEGAKDHDYRSAGNALFPENLKSELREIRSTIEAYSKSSIIEGYEESSACGIKLEYGSSWNATFRVTTNAGTAIYKLDRWD